MERGKLLNERLYYQLADLGADRPDHDRHIRHSDQGCGLLIMDAKCDHRSICPRCNGARILAEWLVEGKIGKAFIVKRHRLNCWKCKGTGEL